MRILIITQWFDPEPTFKGMLFATKLADQGHKVVVLTGFPNYPSGHLYPGYRLRPFKITRDGDVQIIRVALYPSHDDSAPRRFLNYVSFAVSAAAATFFLPRLDVVYVYHPPGTMALPALALHYFRGLPFVYDIQDLWPDTLRATGMLSSGKVLKAVELVMRGVYRRAAMVTTLSPGIAKALAARGVPEQRIKVIYNWTFEGALALSDAPSAPCILEPGRLSAFQVVFAGNMGKAQELDVVLDAAGICEELELDVLFHLVGDGVDFSRLESIAQSRRLENVRFHGRRDPSSMPAILAGADALLIHLRPDPLFRITIPSKTQAALLAGKPILMGVEGDAEELVKEAGAGLSFEPGNPESLVDAVIELASLPRSARESMGKRGLQFYNDHLSSAIGVQSFLDIFSTVLRSRRDERRVRAFKSAALVATCIGAYAACRISASQAAGERQK